MTRKTLTRRRMILVSATAAGGALLAGPAGIAAMASASAPATHIWRGIALGAEAQILLVHGDPNRARDLLNRCRIEIRRLENLFSVYRDTSALSALNRHGKIETPDPALLELMSQCHAISEATSGAFDITVQPLWTFYADHFSSPKKPGVAPGAAALARVQALVDYRQIEFSPQRIAFKRPHMAATFNGIAQGYITDRIAALLRANGFENVLVHLGETRALGKTADGAPWKAGIAHPALPPRLVKTVPLTDQAIATSAGSGTPFTPDGKYHHLFDPHTGLVARRYGSVTVIARNATIADGLSTAFSAMPLPEIERVLGDLAQTSAIIIQNNNEIVEL